MPTATELFEAELDASQERNGWTDEQTAEAKNRALMIAAQFVEFTGFDPEDSDQSGAAMEDDVFAALGFAALRIGLDDANRGL